MINLPNNCRAGKFSVFPANWKTIKANVKLTWRITYWFYDDNLNKRKQVVIKGMNGFQNLREKQDATQTLLDDELYEIKEKGFNRVTEVYSGPESENEISEFTPFIQALDWAFEAKKAENATKTDIKSVLNYLKPAIIALHYDRLPIGQVKKKHLKLVLEKCGKMKVNTEIIVSKKKGITKKGTWNANQYNHYRKYLSALYNELAQVDAVEGNPVEYIDKAQALKKIRETLTREQRTEINKFLFENYYSFWRFLQVFFHSGARITEILNVKTEDVELQNQRFKVIVKKGSQHSEKYRTIKNIILPLWQEIMRSAKKGQFLFGESLMPSTRAKAIRREQITTRWKRHVKDKLGVTADFYSLKHTNIDEVTELLNIQEAQKMAGHSTPVITLTYAVGEEGRKDKALREVGNSFA